MFSTQSGVGRSTARLCSGELVDPPPLSLPNSQGKKMKLALNDVPIVSWCQYFNYGKRKEMNFLVDPAACSESQWRLSKCPTRAPKS